MVKIIGKMFTKKLYTQVEMLLMVLVITLIMGFLFSWVDKKHQEKKYDNGTVQVKNIEISHNCKIIKNNHNKRKRLIKSCKKDSNFTEDCGSLIWDLYPDKRKCKKLILKVVRVWGGLTPVKWTDCNKIKNKNLKTACDGVVK